MNTSPVGVVVFDAQTGAPVSLNREAVRIVESLREPEQSPEDLLEVVTFARADGPELSLPWTARRPNGPTPNYDLWYSGKEASDLSISEPSLLKW